MNRRDVARVIVALCVALAFIKTGARFPTPVPLTTLRAENAEKTAFLNNDTTVRVDSSRTPLRLAPVFVYSEPVFAPLIVRAAHIIKKERRLLARGPFDRAPTGQQIRVSLTQYCLQGTTRRDNYVREGIVAADPRVFPLARYVELFVGKHYLGKFLVDDTGANVKGATLDIWNPSCSEARRFGRQWGTARLVAR